eukprot:TRINITY_DN327_c0_g1_i15.p3 TRINITY_DN327_c0_g1~~TRINITY_DN327_c0_g1_i15.p3  ORF type:complete len:106 (-),score=48.05 TRINITY_DN327_c0_g1_i15:34-351(-)
MCIRDRQQRAPNQVQPQYQIPKSDNNPFTLPQQQSVEFKRNKPQVEEDSDSDDEIDFQKYAAKGADLENEDSEYDLSLIHISEPTRQAEISYAVFCLKKKKLKDN